MANNPTANAGGGYVRKISAQAETDEKPLGRVKDMQRFLMDFENKNKEDNQRHVYQKKAGPRPWEVKKMEQQQKQEEEKLKQQKQEEEKQQQKQEEEKLKQEEELQKEEPAVQEEEKEEKKEEEKDEEDFDKDAEEEEEEEDEEASAMDDFGKSSRCACVLLHM